MARTFSVTDDDSISEQAIDMVRVNLQKIPATTQNSNTNLTTEYDQTDDQQQTIINDFLLPMNMGLMHDANREYEQPNLSTFRKIEYLLEKMQDENNGLPIKSVKSFMSKIPSVFTGADLIQWILKNLDVDDTIDALHLGNLISAHGYVLPIDDHVLTVKNDGTFYRFQTPYFWPSNHVEPNNIDYAVYLCKRTMQNKTRLELADYEAENLARLQKLFARKWEFIYMQAEAQIKYVKVLIPFSHLDKLSFYLTLLLIDQIHFILLRVDKKRDKVERNVLDSQERAFWDVYRAAPGCINMTDQDIKKLMRRKTSNAGFHITSHSSSNNRRSSSTTSTPAPASALAAAANRNLITLTASLFSSVPPPAARPTQAPSPPALRECDETREIDNLVHEIEFLKRRIERRCLKTSKVCESYINYYEQYSEFDPFMTTCEPSNPWISDSIDLWELEKFGSRDISSRRVKRWGFSIIELLKDSVGRDHFWKFLDKEYSSENLRFYEACIQLRFHIPQKDVANKVKEIYNEFLSPGAYYSINIDQRIMNLTKQNMSNHSSRYTFDEAQEHIFNLMTRDTYNRFLRSELYKELLMGGKKKVRE
ncbi:unnamed protein product [Didymodactylos carnosus]|uniref:Uncharacterized protein n=1 Tax=Didymodactylos carnosus TaxID=1234261 RepID=A0A8S2CUC9_9BILA|nr:unnamed protein product [Didymodactylos carnosus]CAF3560336.1 unnamed protein product [Didymodactylos carnosus]